MRVHEGADKFVWDPLLHGPREMAPPQRLLLLITIITTIIITTPKDPKKAAKVLPN